nr:Carboxypeptidase regulatory-like domain protein [uncultured bacterium]
MTGKLPPSVGRLSLCTIVACVFMVLFQLTTYAQGPCKLKTVKVKGILAGTVFLDRGTERQPLTGVVIDVLNANDRKTANGASSSDDGSYVIKGLEPGTYIVKTVHMIPADFEFGLEVTESKEEKVERLVNITLGLDKSKECGGGKVETEKVKKQSDE